MQLTIETHPLAPFLPFNSRVLLLGSFPPPEYRWKINFYYPNYNNDMWRIMGLIFYQDKNYFIDIENKSFKQDLIERFLNQYGIAISDTAQKVIRLKDNASDNFLQIIQQRNISYLLKRIPDCQTIITTGEKATRILMEQYGNGLVIPKIGESRVLKIAKSEVILYRLPSTSRAYPLALEKKAEYYHIFFKQFSILL